MDCVNLKENLKSQNKSEDEIIAQKESLLTALKKLEL